MSEVMIRFLRLLRKGWELQNNPEHPEQTPGESDLHTTSEYLRSSEDYLHVHVKALFISLYVTEEGGCT